MEETGQAPLKDPVRAEAGRKGAAARKKHSNGFIKAREFAREERDIETLRKQIKVGMLQARLHSMAMGRVKGDTVQVQAAKALLDKALPTLQAVETTQVEAAVSRSEAELLAALRDLMLGNPHLVQQILGEQARSSPAAVADTTHAAVFVPEQPATGTDDK